ncbi:conserved hypothetical protein [Perkinsus marinus ATCC 50983]|uniref:Uncharacterized protein n=1 Tax=Perkinsus marinus (strain ATCC 50983 / TXsc) TaxID=423536 RepID=C5LHZ1_PERM5|nr:conserved hypothetical protein [Perkinsus marinus ATCC 50983]EER03745.1 conserved hypothetical protein [Perkinsus marinus ATCC 50983]|eukprot:XP_002771929.1 conserved hypothetical protein [Perkinsus marinus ATCC 50983]
MHADSLMTSPELWAKLVATKGVGLTETEQEQIVKELDCERARNLKAQQELHRKREKVNRGKEMMREREKKAKEDKMAAEMEERQQRRKEELKIWFEKKDIENRERLARERAQIRALQDAKRAKKERERERQELFDKEREIRLRRRRGRRVVHKSSPMTVLTLSGGVASAPVIGSDLEVRKDHHGLNVGKTEPLFPEGKRQIGPQSAGAVNSMLEEPRTQLDTEESSYLVPLPRRETARVKKLKKFFKSTEDAFAT